VAKILPQYSEDEERILNYGYRNVLRCPPEVGLTDLAVTAGQRALSADGVDPGDLDLVVLAITDICEYFYWDAAASVAHRLGADRAEAMLLTQACTGGVVEFDAVAGRFATHPSYRTALLVAANRTCDEYWNRLDTLPMVFSDGAAAAVARRNHQGLRWLASEVITDGRYADLFRLDAGGAAAPFGAAPVPADALRARDVWGVMEYFDYDVAQFERFATLQDQRTREVIAAACARAGLATTDIARFLLLNDNREALTKLAASLGVPEDRTNLHLSLEHGHLGAADQLFCLSRYHADGALIEGERLALASRGRGMHWACTILQV